MDRLRISLTDIPDDGLDLEVQVAVNELSPPGAEAVPMETVDVQGTLTPVSDDFLFQGRLQGTFIQPCDRCLQPAHHRVVLDVLWSFTEGGVPLTAPEFPDEDTEFGSEDSDVVEQEHAYQGEVIDLAPLVWEELVLAAPTKYVCHADCQGLCPQCGANLNETNCTCGEAEAAEGNAAFEKLRDLFPDLPKT